MYGASFGVIVLQHMRTRDDLGESEHRKYILSNRPQSPSPLLNNSISLGGGVPSPYSSSSEGGGVPG